MTYDEFLHGKVQFKTAVGFDITDDEINPLLKPHQRDVVRWAGRAVELNPGYFMDGVAHLKAQEAKASMPSLFDLAEVSA